MKCLTPPAPPPGVDPGLSTRLIEEARSEPLVCVLSARGRWVAQSSPRCKPRTPAYCWSRVSTCGGRKPAPDGPLSGVKPCLVLQGDARAPRYAGVAVVQAFSSAFAEVPTDSRYHV